MIAYIDASVILRLVLRQPGKLKEWRRVEHGVASALVEVECVRTIDRLRVQAHLNDAEASRRRAAVYTVTAELEVVELSTLVLSRAAQPFPSPLGTLDAIHLTTAVLWKELHDKQLVMATHDHELGSAARAMGLEVIGA